MSQETKKPKINKAKWTKLQLVGFWVLITGSLLFWGGVYVGTQSTLNAQAHEQSIKTQAIEAYKAELKNSEQ